MLQKMKILHMLQSLHMYLACNVESISRDIDSNYNIAICFIYRQFDPCLLGWGKPEFGYTEPHNSQMCTLFRCSPFLRGVERKAPEHYAAVESQKEYFINLRNQDVSDSGNHRCLHVHAVLGVKL